MGGKEHYANLVGVEKRALTLPGEERTLVRHDDRGQKETVAARKEKEVQDDSADRRGRLIAATAQVNQKAQTQLGPWREGNRGEKEVNEDERSGGVRGGARAHARKKGLIFCRTQRLDTRRGEKKKRSRKFRWVDRKIGSDSPTCGGVKGRGRVPASGTA